MLVEGERYAAIVGMYEGQEGAEEAEKQGVLFGQLSILPPICITYKDRYAP